MLPKCLGEKIEKVQKRAFRIIYPTTDYEDALNTAQCKRLDDRRQELCAKTFKKILKPDAHLNHLLPPPQMIDYTRWITQPKLCPRFLVGRHFGSKCNPRILAVSAILAVSVARAKIADTKIIAIDTQ